MAQTRRSTRLATAQVSSRKRAAPAPVTNKKTKARKKTTSPSPASTSNTISSSTAPTKSRTKSTKASRKKATPTQTTSPTPVTPTSPTPTKSSTKAITKSPIVQKKKSGGHPVDPDVPGASTYTVVESAVGLWYDAVLNQCNITGSSNNNKYYRIQMLKKSYGFYYVWLKWGRVGEPSTGRDLKGPFDTECEALPTFYKKYRDKTGNKFDAETFVQKKGKYIPLDIDNDVEVDPNKAGQINTSSNDPEVEYLPSELDPKTKGLIEVLFSKEMRNEALTSFNLDLKRLPLGVPSEQQIQLGVDVLKQIENKLNGGQERSSYPELSSQFYTTIPHSFGRRRPPVISDQESLQQRFDMCNILLDMHSTNETLMGIEKEIAKVDKKKIPAPVDSHYKSLKADLTVLDKKKKEYKMIQTYFDKTKSGYSGAELLDVWAIDRNGEMQRHQTFEDLDNRKLLWHGTNIAVAAPIMTSGLRIMPHSGGRVGSGIYLAAMQEKSAQYTCYYGSKFACMFLVEAALGKSHTVTSDGSHASGLKKAPKGFDSVHAVGTTQPQNWKQMQIDKNNVEIPQAGAKASNVNSSFHHDEYLVYNEAQVRLRYVVTVKF